MKNNRREFIKKTGLAGLAITAAPIRNTLNEIIKSAAMESKIKFISPIDGDMLTQYDGMISDGSLITEVRISAPPGMKLMINEVPANFADGRYAAQVPLKNYKNVIYSQTTSYAKTCSFSPG